MIDLYKKYNDTKYYLETNEKIFNKLRIYLSSSEILDFTSLSDKLKSDIKDIEDQLKEEKVCINCGKKLTEKNFFDEDVGTICVLYCSKCKKVVDINVQK